MTARYGVVKGYSKELVRGASHPPFLTLTVESRLGIYSDRHEPFQKARLHGSTSLQGAVVSLKERKLTGLAPALRL